MHVFVFLILSVLMNPVLAITKCELKGKVIYKEGGCPEHAVTKYWVNGKYITEQQLKEYQQQGKIKSEQAFKQINTPDKKVSTVELKATALEAEESTHTQAEILDAQDIESSPIHVNVPRAFEYVNPKLEAMDRKLDEHNKKLQQIE